MSVKRALWVVGGCVFFGLAAAGAALPVLPTVPFLLLSAACFSRGSRRMDAWFKSTSLYRNHLEGYMRGQGMTWGTKLRIMAIATAMMGLSGAVFLRGVLIAQVALVVLWVAMVVTFVFVIKTARPSDEASAGAANELSVADSEEQ